LVNGKATAKTGASWSPFLHKIGLFCMDFMLSKCWTNIGKMFLL